MKIENTLAVVMGANRGIARRSCRLFSSAATRRCTRPLAGRATSAHSPRRQIAASSRFAAM